MTIGDQMIISMGGNNLISEAFIRAKLLLVSLRFGTSGKKRMGARLSSRSGCRYLVMLDAATLENSAEKISELTKKTNSSFGNLKIDCALSATAELDCILRQCETDDKQTRAKLSKSR